MTAYVTSDYLAENFPLDTKPEEAAVIERDSVAASRFVDAATGQPMNYFAPAAPDVIADASAIPPIEAVDNSTVKIFIGNGRSILPVGMFTETSIAEGNLATVEGHTIAAYTLLESPSAKYLSLTETNRVWTYNQPYTLRAHYGFIETPTAIQKAVIQIVLGWRQRESGVLGQINPDGFYQETDMPITARALIEAYRRDPLDDLRVPPSLTRYPHHPFPDRYFDGLNYWNW